MAIQLHIQQRFGILRYVCISISWNTSAIQHNVMCRFGSSSASNSVRGLRYGECTFRFLKFSCETGHHRLTITNNKHTGGQFHKMLHKSIFDGNSRIHPLFPSSPTDQRRLFWWDFRHDFDRGYRQLLCNTANQPLPFGCYAAPLICASCKGIPWRIRCSLHCGPKIGDYHHFDISGFCSPANSSRINN